MGRMEIKNEKMRSFMSMLFAFVLLLLFYPYDRAEIADMEDGAEKSAVPYENDGTEESAALYRKDETEESQTRRVALTFDDGPNAVYTPMLLNGLKERGIKATFFLIGSNVEEGDNRELVKRMRKEGHVLGNHTYHHRELTSLSEEEAYQELKATSDLVKSITGEDLEYMRPPFGAWQKELDRKIPMIPVLWSVDTLDWTTGNVDEIVRHAVEGLGQEGSGRDDIILMHDCYESSVKAAFRIIDLLQARGYEFVTVDALIQP